MKDHIFLKHLTSSKNCKDRCDLSCFKILDPAPGYFINLSMIKKDVTRYITLRRVLNINFKVLYIKQQ